MAVVFAPENEDGRFDVGGIAAGEAVDVDAAIGVLTGLTPLLAGVRTGECSADELQRMVVAARSAQRSVDGFVTLLGLAADRLAERDGAGLGARELLGSRRGGVRSSTARRDAARSAAVAALPGFADAVTKGQVGGDQLDTMARAVNDLDDDQVAQLDTDQLVDAARDLPADTFNRLVRGEVERIKGDHGLDDTVAKRRGSSCNWWFDEKTGTGRLAARLDPERYEAVTNAIQAAMTTLANHSDEPITKDQRLAADALVHLVTGGGTGSGLPAITIIVDADTMARGGHDTSVRETAEGRPVPPETIARLACDATIRKVMLDGTSVPISVGRRYRTATDAQWAAAKAIYSGCGWHGCSAPISWCQLHHIHEWEKGGSTDLCNMVPLCHRHHHLVHEGRWSISMRADRSLDIRRPDGQLWAITPPPSRRQPRRAGRDAAGRNAAPAGTNHRTDPP